MKKLALILFAFIYVTLLSAQSGGSFYSIEFNENDIQNLKKTSDGAYLIEGIAIQLKAVNTFIAFSTRLEGNYLAAGSIDFQIKINEKEGWKNIEPFHDGDFNGSKWIPNLTFLDKNTPSIALKIKILTANTSITGAYLRFYVPDDIVLSKAEGQGAGGVLAGCEVPPSVSRASWSGSTLSTGIAIGTPTYTTVTHLIVHHSAGPNTSSNWAATVKSIFDYHTQTNGWSDIGYNYLISPDGQLFVGRGGGNNVVGAHMCGYNANTMGVCLLGTYTDIAPPQVALDKLRDLLAWKSVDSKIDPSGSGNIRAYYSTMQNISGHRDGCAPNYTECPGDKLYALLPTLRTSVKTAVTACLTSIEDFSDVQRFDIAPNPSKGQFNLNIDLKNAQNFNIEIVDILGKTVYKQLIDKGLQHINLPINIEQLPQGLYYVALKKDNQLRIKKFVKE